MRDWLRALSILLLTLVGWIGFYRVAGAGSIGQGSITNFATSSGSAGAVAQGAQGVLVNGLSGIPQGPPFNIGLDVEISTNAVRSRAGQPLTLFGTLGGVIIDSASLLTATNVNVLTAIASPTASLTTINTDIIQQRNAVTTQFKSAQGWSFDDGTGTKTTTITVGTGVFNVNVTSASGGFVLATSDWYGGNLAFLTTVNVTNLNATNKVSASVIDASFGSITTLNVSNSTTTGIASAGSFDGPQANITTVRTTRTEANGVTGTVSATLLLSQNATTTSLVASGPTGTVSTTLLLSQNATTTSLQVSILNAINGSNPVRVNAAQGLSIASAAGAFLTQLAATSTTLFVDIVGSNGFLDFGSTDGIRTTNASIQANGLTGNVSTTILNAETANVTRVNAGNANATGTVSATFLQTSNATVTTFVRIEGQTGDAPDLVAGSLSYNKTLRTHRITNVFGTGSPWIVMKDEVGTFTVGNVATLTKLGNDIPIKLNSLAAGSMIRLEMSGRFSLLAAGTIDIAIMVGGAGGQRIGGFQPGFNTVDLAAACTNSIFYSDIRCLMIDNPDSATNTFGGGYVAMRRSAGQFMVGFGCDPTSATADFSAASVNVACFVNYGAANPANTITAGEMVWSICSPNQ